MSEKRSLVIIAVALIAIIVVVYYFSTPTRPDHFLPVGVSQHSRTVDSAAGAPYH